MGGEGERGGEEGRGRNGKSEMRRKDESFK